MYLCITLCIELQRYAEYIIYINLYTVRSTLMYEGNLHRYACGLRLTAYKTVTSTYIDVFRTLYDELIHLNALMA